jgi:ketosteroid isomerase-like protein
MKQPLLAGIALSLVATMFGQHVNDAAQAEIVKLGKEFEEAMISNDATRIGSYLADDWIIIDPDGGIIDKVGFLSVIRSGTLVHEAMGSEDVRVRVFGTAAVVTALTSSKSKYMNREFETRERTTDVFVKREGRWQCVITHLTKFSKQ